MMIVIVEGKSMTVEERIAEIDAIATGNRKTAMPSLHEIPCNDMKNFGRTSIWSRIASLLPQTDDKPIKEPTIVEEAFPLTRFMNRDL